MTPAAGAGWHGAGSAQPVHSMPCSGLSGRRARHAAAAPPNPPFPFPLFHQRTAAVCEKGDERLPLHSLRQVADVDRSRNSLMLRGRARPAWGPQVRGMGPGSGRAGSRGKGSSNQRHVPARCIHAPPPSPAAAPTNLHQHSQEGVFHWDDGGSAGTDLYDGGPKHRAVLHQRLQEGG